ncbi:MAG TPA: hypothetical protein VMF05_10980 [Stellaceae bacterium]|nr:hypothetical protein [Stellaceae bacterium]
MATAPGEPPSPDPAATAGLSLTDALIAGAEPASWARYCRLAAELEGRPAIVPAPAPGSLEWQRRQDQPVLRTGQPLPAEALAAGCRRLARRGTPAPFTGAPPPFGAAGRDAYDAFLAAHRGPEALLAQLDGLEAEVVAAFAAAGRAGRLRATGFHHGTRVEIGADWFDHAIFDFARNTIRLPDGSTIAGVSISWDVTDAPPAAGAADTRGDPGRQRRQRPAQAMLRQALATLWERQAFGVGTGNERVLALVLRELGLSPANPPYGFKSAETVRKLRKELKMSL